MNSVSINQYILNRNNCSLDDIICFFSNKHWIKLDENLFRRRYTSVFFEIKHNEFNFVIEVWGVGPFGIIIPLDDKWRMIGFVDKYGDRIIIKEFESFLQGKNIEFTKGITQKKGKPQKYYLLAILVYIIVLIIVLFLFNK